MSEQFGTGATLAAFYGERPSRHVGEVEVGDWTLKAYVIGPRDVMHQIPVDAGLRGARVAVEHAVTSNLSEEFHYAKTGFVLIHHGRKGVTIHVFYWSDWRGTTECHGWAEYAYGHEYGDFEPLDQKEPLFCGWDLPIIAFETESWLRAVMEAESESGAVAAYLNDRYDAHRGLAT